jgi:hypothetical protein
MFTTCMLADEVTPVLERHNMLDLNPDEWYPLGRWMAFIDDLRGKEGAMYDFVAVGLRVAEVTYLPPQVLQMPFEMLMTTAIPQGHSVGYRNGYTGYCKVERVGPGHLLYRLNSPFPDDLNYGIFFGYVRRFLPKGTKFTVKYDETAPRQDHGGDETLIHVIWHAT